MAVVMVQATGCSPQSGESISADPAANRPNQVQESPGEQTLDPIDRTVSPAESSKTSADVSIRPQEPGQAESERQAMRLFLGDPITQSTENAASELTEAQLNKNFTLLLLASQPDIRARIIIRYARNILTEQQMAEAVKLVLEDDYQFQKLILRRAEVLEHAYDNQNVQVQLREIDEATVRVSQQIRKKFHSRILTPQQREQLIAEREQQSTPPKAVDAEQQL